MPHGTPLPCTACDGTGQARPLPQLAVARHVRQMIRTCWELGKLPEFAELKLWKWAHMLGFRGHFSTKSRRYSTTLGALRAEAAHGAPNRPTPASPNWTRQPLSSSATGTTRARATTPAARSSRPTSGTAGN
ncbi:replication initiator [Streptomyces sp. NPDC005551]|uniref:replication initiator n=1 Tax=Streptomyces sp. NPDC005551 TaxID=3364725 RepID=UPI0036CC1189